LNADTTISAASPCVNTGLTVADVVLDYRGLSRPQGARYDMGAYEYQLGTTIISHARIVSQTKTAFFSQHDYSYNLQGRQVRGIKFSDAVLMTQCQTKINQRKIIH
jgi:hypothetical protein